MKGQPVLILFLMLVPTWLYADVCRLETESEVQQARKRLDGVTMIVTVCGHCETNDPVPLRIKSYDFRHFEPDTVAIPIYEETYPVSSLKDAMEKNSGPLASSLRAKIDEDYKDETGFLPNDPYLIKEKRDRYKMLLDFALEDYEMRTWDELVINGERVNPVQVYYPIGGNQYRNLGRELNCEVYSKTPDKVAYQRVRASAETEAPPEKYIADVTGQCYDGSCPAAQWKVYSATTYFNEAEGEEAGVLDTDEVVIPLQTLSYVKGSKAVAYRDHDHIFEGDVFYVLDSQAEGFHRFWHYGNVFIADGDGVKYDEGWNYCEKKDTCWATAKTQSTSVWWSKVQRQDGSSVWVKDPMASLTGVLVD